MLNPETLSKAKEKEIFKSFMEVRLMYIWCLLCDADPERGCFSLCRNTILVGVGLTRSKTKVLIGFCNF